MKGERKWESEMERDGEFMDCKGSEEIQPAVSSSFWILFEIISKIFWGYVQFLG